MKLNQSKVNFNKGEHTYILAGEELNGITGILNRQLFADKYKGIPEHILAAAAQYGTYIHSVCEAIDTVGVVADCIEATNYVKLTKENNLEHVESEYLISDNDYAASLIDKIYQGENPNEFILADIKTTSQFDEDYLAWQLGCYKYLFELQNPDCRITACYAIWLRNDKSALTPIEPKTADECKELIACDKAGGETYAEKHGLQYGRKKEDMPADMLSKEDLLLFLMLQKSTLEEKIAQIKEEFLDEMTKHNASTWKGYNLTITRKADSKRTDFDKKRFQSEHADLYNNYIKETTIKGGISIRMT